MYRDAEGFWRVTTIRLRRITHVHRMHVEPYSRSNQLIVNNIIPYVTVKLQTAFTDLVI